MNWISVKDRLPALRVWVLVFLPFEKDNCYVYSAFLNESFEHREWPKAYPDPLEWEDNSYEGGFQFKRITHWMPLPEPPSETKKETSDSE